MLLITFIHLLSGFKEVNLVENIIQNLSIPNEVVVVGYYALYYEPQEYDLQFIKESKEGNRFLINLIDWMFLNISQS